MAKPPAKSKQVPWIPPPGRYLRHCKTHPKAPYDALKKNPGSSKNSKQNLPDYQKHVMELTYNIELKDNIPVMDSPDGSIMGVNGAYQSPSSTDSSFEKVSDFYIHVQSIKQEMKILNKHLASLRSSLKLFYGFQNSLDLEESAVKELVSKIKSSIEDFESSYEYLECSLILWENVVDESDKITEYSNVMKCKEHLLTKLLEAYGSSIVLFQTELKCEKNKEHHKSEDCLKKRLQETERKCSSQDALIKDLERRVSIYQGKSNALESYKSTVEETRNELQKELSHKDKQIKYLNSEVVRLSKKQDSADHEKLIEIIEDLKNRAHAEKTALKKALKHQRIYADKKEEKVQHIQAEMKEKYENMIFDIATQRDQLKVDLTVSNNKIIQLKNQVEEMKQLNSRHEEKLKEIESSKIELQIRNETLQQKISSFETITEAKIQYQKNYEDMKEKLSQVEKELSISKERNADLENEMHSRMKNYGNLSAAFQEIKHLVSLLQDTKLLLQDFKIVSQTPNGTGDHASYDLEPDNSHNNVLAVVQETKEHLFELKKLYHAFTKECYKSPKETEMKEQLLELQKQYDIFLKENEELKDELEALKSSKQPDHQTSVSQSELNMHQFQRIGSSGDHVDSMLKINEIQRIKYDYGMKLKDLEYELKEAKDKLQKQELQNIKLASLEEELKLKKQELSILEHRKEEENERFHRKIKELQESLDSVNANYESLQRYAQQMKTSYFNVFGIS